MAPFNMIAEFLRNRNVVRKWVRRGEIEAIKFLCCAFGLLISSIIGAVTVRLTNDTVLGGLVLMGSTLFLMPASVLISARMLRKMTGVDSNSTVTHEILANEQDYQEDDQKIRDMGLPPEKQAELLIENFQDYRLRKNEIKSRLFGNGQRFFPENQQPPGAA